MARPSDIRATLRKQIAAATRLTVMEDIMDYSGHISVRVPASEDGPGSILIQGASDSRAELDPADILEVAMDGTVLEGSDGPGKGRPPLELPLHLEILKARPDVNAVLHCHMELAITFTLMQGQRIEVMRSRAARWAGGVPVHPDPGLVRSTGQGQALAATLGDAHAALIRCHGLVMCAESVPALFTDVVHFKENVTQQMAVLQAGQVPLPMTQAELAMLNGPRGFHVNKLWKYYVGLGQSRGLLDPAWSADAGTADDA